jgi:hypothetical protein
MGLLETGLYVGIVAGTIICPILFSVMSPKILIAVSSLLNGLFAVVIVIGNENNYWIIFASRVLVGLFLVTLDKLLITFCSRYSYNISQYGLIFVHLRISKLFGFASSI